MKKLLVSGIRGLIADAGVQSLVIVAVRIVGAAGLCVGQVGKDWLVPEFKHLRFELGPATFGLGIVVAVTASALRAQGPVLVEPAPGRRCRNTDRRGPRGPPGSGREPGRAAPAAKRQ